MSLSLTIGMYFVIWWTLLFVALPLGVRSQIESGEVVPGSEGAAPAQPMLLKKMAITSVLAAIALAIVYIVIEFRLIPLDSLSFLVKF